MDQREGSRFFTAALLPALGIAVLWSIFLLDEAYGWRIHRLGILPRDVFGSVGIIMAPFIHGDAAHAFNNSIALFVLGWCLMFFYPKAAGRVVIGTWLLGGIMVWLTARPDRHIGASGIVYGLAAFLFFSGVIRRQRSLMAISLLVVFLYGSMVWGVLPILPSISWESHLWGGLAGAFLAWWYRGIEPAHLPKPIVFEEDADDDPSVEGRAIVYHTDPGDEEDEEEMRHRQRHPPGTRLDEGATDTTW